jgi:hypothetical protein
VMVLAHLRGNWELNDQHSHRYGSALA